MDTSMRRRAMGGSRPLYDIKSPRDDRGMDTSMNKSRNKKHKDATVGKVHLVNADSLVTIVHELVGQVREISVRLGVVESVALPNQDVGAEIERLNHLLQNTTRKTNQLELQQKDTAIRQSASLREVGNKITQLEYLLTCDRDQRKTVEPAAKHNNIFNFCKLIQKDVMEAGTEVNRLRQEVSALAALNNNNFSIAGASAGPLTIGDLSVTRDPRVEGLTDRLEVLEAFMENKADPTTTMKPFTHDEILHPHQHQQQQQQTASQAGVFDLLTTDTTSTATRRTPLLTTIPGFASVDTHEDLQRREASVLLKEELLAEKEALLNERLRMLEKAQSEARSSVSAKSLSPVDELVLTRKVKTQPQQPQVHQPSPAPQEEHEEDNRSKSSSVLSTELTVPLQQMAAVREEVAAIAVERAASIASSVKSKKSTRSRRSREESIASSARSKKSSVVPSVQESKEDKDDPKHMDLASLLDALTTKPAEAAVGGEEKDSISGSRYSRHSDSSSLSVGSIDASPPRVPARNPPAVPFTRPVSLLAKPDHITPAIPSFTDGDDEDSDPLTM
eukprot:TRINITY_DN21447_c0_g1_i1.p1 TRINITY_DN21447_c0_g1~~TRINITY_DN21447_c0_g1_i1.p1  ORF type:complete len:561 (+),score=113.79 TRINITY_DN21447_c0_g1_i1:55-1737(+)